MIASDLRKERQNAGCTPAFRHKMINRRPPRRLQPSGGVANLRKQVDMPEVTPACAKPTRKYPEGRTGTSAGHSAHRAAGERPCDPCRLAFNIDCNRRHRPRAERQRRHYAENKLMYAYRAIRRKYNITREQYDALLEKQGGRCAICRTDKPGNRSLLLNVDHDHACCPGGKSCGKCVRGLLCAYCNVGLGAFRDDAERLAAAAAYLTSKRTEVVNAAHD